MRPVELLPNQSLQFTSRTHGMYQKVGSLPARSATRMRLVKGFSGPVVREWC